MSVARTTGVLVGDQRKRDREHQQPSRNQCIASRRRAYELALLGQRGGRRRAGRRPEKPLRLQRQHDRHDDEFRGQRELGKRDGHAEERLVAQRDAHRLDQRDDERGQECAGDRAQATDDRDDEGIGDRRQVHPEIGGLARELQRTR
jgi:hypothetical protein